MRNASRALVLSNLPSFVTVGASKARDKMISSTSSDLVSIPVSRTKPVTRNASDSHRFWNAQLMRLVMLTQALLLAAFASSPIVAQATASQNAQDVRDQSSEAKPAATSLPWVSFADYPKSELDAGRAGLTIIAVTVGLDGAVKQCRTVKSSGSVILDDEACRLVVLRGKFDPAKDKSGNPTSALYFLDIDWRFDKNPKVALPKGNPGNWATGNDYPAQALKERRGGTTYFNLTVGADGKVLECVVTISSGHRDLDETACARSKARARFQPATDRMGVPVIGSFSHSIRWFIVKDEPINEPNDPILSKASARCIHIGLALNSKKYQQCVSKQLVLLSKVP